MVEFIRSYIIKTWTPKLNTTGAQVLLAPLSERERKLLEGSNAKKEEIMKKGQKGHKGDKSSIWVLIRQCYRLLNNRRMN